MIRFKGFGPMFYVFLVSILLLMQAVSRADSNDLKRRAAVRALDSSGASLGATFESSNAEVIACKSRGGSWPSRESGTQLCSQYCFKVNAQYGGKKGQVECSTTVQEPDLTVEALKKFEALGGVTGTFKHAGEAVQGKAPDVPKTEEAKWKLFANCDFVVPGGWYDDRDSLPSPKISYDIPGDLQTPDLCKSAPAPAVDGSAPAGNSANHGG